MDLKLEAGNFETLHLRVKRSPMSQIVGRNYKLFVRTEESLRDATKNSTLIEEMNWPGGGNQGHIGCVYEGHVTGEPFDSSVVQLSTCDRVVS